MRLYGPSDYQDLSVTHTDGTTCHHDLRKGREAIPGYGNQDRTLPVVNCPKCEQHLLKSEGFANHPDKVRKTADELEYIEISKNEGTMASKLMAESFGNQLAKLASENLKNAPRR